MNFQTIKTISLSIIFIFCAFPVLLTAQTGAISGKVHNGNNQPILAGIFINELPKSTQTDGNGNYSFNSLTDQKYTLFFTSDLHKSKTITVVVANGQPFIVPLITLEESENNIAKAKSLPMLIDQNRFTKLENRVEFLLESCGSEKGVICEKLTQIDVAVKRKNFGDAKIQSEELVKIIESRENP